MAALAAVAAALAGGCGGDGGGSEEEAIRTTVRDYVGAVTAGDGSAACAALTPAGARRLLVDLRRQSDAVRGLTCEEAVAATGTELSPAQRRAIDRLRVSRVEVDGERATAQLAPDGGDEPTRVALARTRDGWRLDGPASATTAARALPAAKRDVVSRADAICRRTATEADRLGPPPSRARAAETYAGRARAVFERAAASLRQLPSADPDGREFDRYVASVELQGRLTAEAQAAYAGGDATEAERALERRDRVGALGIAAAERYGLEACR